MQRERAAVLLAAVLLALPFLGKAWHVDEPFFLAIARHILQDPFHPLAFEFNWYGAAVPMAAINNTPPLFPYLLAPVLAWTGEAEALSRLLFLPFDLLAALSLHALASRFLKRPLLPVLIVLAGPAWLIDMGHLMPEKPAMALGLAGLWALMRSLDRERPAWFWGSALLLGASVMSKYLGAVFLLPAAALAFHRGVRPARLAAWLALALSPLALHLLLSPSAVSGAWSTTAAASQAWWSGWPHKLRSFLAFTGGLGVAVLAWPYLLGGRKAALACAGAALLLFSPWLDLLPARPLDRAAGVVMASGALLALLRLFASPSLRTPGWPLWAPWALSGVLLQLGLYWSVMARAVLFVLPPLTLWMAEALERAWAEGRLRRLYGATLALTLALGLSLAWTDLRYAGAQRDFARTLPAGRTWFTGHWGFQYYLERAGARALDRSRGGWAQTAPGDAVALSVVNCNQVRALKPVFSDVETLVVGFPLPLRLLSGWDGQGGFYSNSYGFLPYSFSREPLEEFRTVRLKVP